MERESGGKGGGDIVSQKFVKFVKSKGSCHSRKFRIRQQAGEKFIWNPVSINKQTFIT